MTGRRFFCNALAGGSDYNIVVNSDMTVSCNCQDYDGSGRIGDLSKSSLESIFNGLIAKDFRRTLAKGKLPTLTCSRCSELRWIDRKDAQYRKKQNKIPKGLMVENIVLCNLNCIGCQRETVLRIRDKKNLDIDDIRKIALILYDNQVETVSYFNLGEPFLHSNIHDELKILVDYNPDLKIVTSTNGTLMDTDKKREAALLLDTIYFSIFGTSDPILQKYQKYGNFSKAYSNLKAFVEYRNNKGMQKPVIEWKYVLFNWNDKYEMIFKVPRQTTGVQGLI